MRDKLLLPFLVLSSMLLVTSNMAYACGCGCKGNNCGANKQTTTQDVAEEKVQCPVMKSWILPSEAADKAEYNGKTYYFCCGGCKEQFLKNPDIYINSEAES